MLTSFAKKYNINISGILHIGANDCTEYDEYKSITNNIVYIEANPTIVENVKQKNHNINIYQELISNIDNELLEFNISNNNSQSSSILQFNLHKRNHPNIKFINTIPLKSTTIDTFISKYNIININTLVLDIQGIELRALKGSINLLNNIKIIYTEVNIDETYINCDKMDEIDDFLLIYGFKRVYTHIFENHTYGDALYIK